MGGSPTSWHLKGRAVDVIGPLEELREAEAWAREDRTDVMCTGPEEVLLEKPGRVGQHLHIAW